MPNQKRKGSYSPYYDGHMHFSYGSNLVYREHEFKAHETVQDMIRRAQQSMSDNQFKG